MLSVVQQLNLWDTVGHNNKQTMIKIKVKEYVYFFVRILSIMIENNLSASGKTIDFRGWTLTGTTAHRTILLPIFIDYFCSILAQYFTNFQKNWSSFVASTQKDQKIGFRLKNPRFSFTYENKHENRTFRPKKQCSFLVPLNLKIKMR